MRFWNNVVIIMIGKLFLLITKRTYRTRYFIVENIKKKYIFLCQPAIIKKSIEINHQ